MKIKIWLGAVVPEKQVEMVQKRAHLEMIKNNEPFLV